MHPDFEAYFKEKWDDLIKGKVSKTYEYKIIDPEGKERWISQSNKGIFSDTGAITSIEGLCRDITEQKIAEEALKDKTRFLDQIIETSALSMWISDEKGTVIKTNPAFLEFFGATEEEVVGKYNLFQDSVIEKKGAMPIIKGVFEKGKPASFTADYDFGAVDHANVKNATNKIMNTVFTPVLDNDGGVSNIIVQSMDLSEIKELKKKK